MPEDITQTTDAPLDDAVAGAGSEPDRETLARLIFSQPDDAPPSEGIDEPTSTEMDADDQESDAPDPTAERLDQLERERAELLAFKQQTELEKRQNAAQAAEIQWAEIERQAYEYAQSLDYDKALEFAFEFGRERANAFRQIAEMREAAARTEEYRRHVVEQYGLSPDDAARLGDNPYAFDAIAQGLANDRQRYESRISELERQLQQVSRSQRAQGRIASGVDRAGGVGGQPIPPNFDEIPLRDVTRMVLAS